MSERLSHVAGVFAGLAILVACLGLLGLAAFSTRQRTKEIGIRKVLGATVASVVVLLSGDFLRLIAAAFVIAAPLAYFAMQTWLATFAYRIDLSTGAFLAAGGLVLLVAVATVCYQAVRAALADPVTSLRYE
jgi:putative ABC transport system permease protein